jgi:hypothetical protein
MILFLDFDGVMHPDPCSDEDRLFENSERLADVLAHFPEVGVVLSTSWRNVRPLDELLARLPQALRQRVMGVNPNFNEIRPDASRIPYRRHAECEQWLRDHAMEDVPWWALDDRADWFAPYCENLIACAPDCGFDERIAARLYSTLSLARRRVAQDVDLVLC